MKIAVKVKPQAKQQRLEKISDKEYVLWVRQAAIEGKANQAVIEILSEYFGCAKSRVEVIRGLKNKNKIIEIS